MTGITDLAVETRLQIFEYLLQFKHPVKKVKSSKEKEKKKKKDRNARPFHELGHGTKLSIRTNATALLFVNKQFSAEALSTLYKLNTIVLKHADICGSSSPAEPVCDTLLVHSAVLYDPLLWSRDEPCWSGCDTGLAEIVEFLNSEEFPQLRSVTINATQCDSSMEDLRKELRGADPEDVGDELEGDLEELAAPPDKPARSADRDTWMKFAEHTRQQAPGGDAGAVQRDLPESLLRETRRPAMDLKSISVGVCKIISKGDMEPKPDITLRFPDITKTWSYYQSLHWDNHDLCPMCVPPPKVLADVPFTLWTFVQPLFVSRALWWEHAVDDEIAAEAGMEILIGSGMVNVKDSGVGMGDEVLWGRITEAAVEEM